MSLPVSSYAPDARVVPGPSRNETVERAASPRRVLELAKNGVRGLSAAERYRKRAY